MDNWNGEWVGPSIYRFVKDMPIPVEMYAPYGTHPKELAVEFLEQDADRHAEPTGLQYQRGSFGPFSGDLKALEAKLVNNGLLQEERRGKMFMVTVGPNFNRIRQKYAPFFDPWNKILDKTADLFARVNTDQAEVIATVLFVTRELMDEQRELPSESKVLETVMHWKQKRRPPLDRNTVASTIHNLATLRWLAVKADPNLPVSEEEAILA